MAWLFKVIVKVILSKLPVSYDVWRRLSLFRHGQMDSTDYALKVFFQHFREFEKTTQVRDLQDKTIMEIGPGDSLLTALASKAVGFEKSILLDVGDFASKNLDSFTQANKELKERGYLLDFDSSSFDKCLSSLNCQYLTQGLSSLKEIKNDSVDFIFSQAVVEHIRKDEFLEYFTQLKRILKKDGIAIHKVDLKDHLAEGLNNLRFSEKIWEKEFMANAGFYTNRLRMKESLILFEKAGFTINSLEKTTWDKPPIKRKHLSKEFKILSDFELLIKEYKVVMS